MGYSFGTALSITEMTETGARIQWQRWQAQMLYYPPAHVDACGVLSPEDNYQSDCSSLKAQSYQSDKTVGSFASSGAIKGDAGLGCHPTRVVVHARSSMGIKPCVWIAARTSFLPSRTRANR